MKKMHGYVFCNHRHNILRLFDTLPNFLFTTSEAKQIIRAYTSCLMSWSGKIRKDQENTKTSKNYNLLPILPSKIKILLILAKNCWKLVSYILSRILGTDLALENSFYGAIKLIEHTSLNKYNYSGYCIGFGKLENFSLSDSSG